VKNTLMTAQSIASQPLRNAPSLSHAWDTIERRLTALSQVHNVLIDRSLRMWRFTTSSHRQSSFTASR
jgi:two-component sensor histidine kinase